MTSRLARSAIRNLMALWLATAAAHAGDSVLDRMTIEPPGTVLDGRRASAQLIATGHHGDGSVRDLTHASELDELGPGDRGRPSRRPRSSPGRRQRRGARADRIERGEDGHPGPQQHDDSPRPVRARGPARADEGRLQRGCLPRHSHGQERLPAELARIQPAPRLRVAGPREREPAYQPVRARGEPDPPQGDRPGPARGREADGDRESSLYRVLRDWVAEGARPDPARTPKLVGLDVTPSRRVLDDPAREQQLVVRARYDDGSVGDVTRLARFSSTDPAIARVDDDGRVVKQKRGEATILVSFEHLVATPQLVFREPVPGLVWSRSAPEQLHRPARLRQAEAAAASPRPSSAATPCSAAASTST